MEKPQGSLEKLSLGSSLGLCPRELPRDSFSRLHPPLFHSLSQIAATVFAKCLLFDINTFMLIVFMLEDFSLRACGGPISEIIGSVLGIM